MRDEFFFGSGFRVQVERFPEFLLFLGFHGVQGGEAVPSREGFLVSGLTGGEAFLWCAGSSGCGHSEKLCRAEGAC